MNTKLILALTLSVLAVNTFAADGYDRTGSAAFTARSNAAGDSRTDAANVATNSVDRTDAAKVATDSVDRTDTARTN
ncbi:hypothetical protein [Pseudomonas sp. GM55]|jgi:hypothetical protein|uniref:hypothetical protein n=1 Tax=Pseudomonas sp. GM55 TaxID=1144333 RepID=UPI0002709015|nr:hypothetical protein [Pseudomonas sp. GM55]EJM64630.1 hypothetical protein PMI31_06014 [Pseudomonas sp. GM55]